MIGTLGKQKDTVGVVANAGRGGHGTVGQELVFLDIASAQPASPNARPLNAVQPSPIDHDGSKVTEPESPLVRDSVASTHVELAVVEQRLSNLIQALLVAVCLGATPAIKLIPTSLLWGYFAFMALESLPGSQFWDRLRMLVTDPKRRILLLKDKHATYYETVPFRVISLFTAIQFGMLMGVWALVTWAGVAGIAFPIPIMALVPLRIYVLPRVFKHQHLQELDADEYQEAPPLSSLGPGAAGGAGEWREGAAEGGGAAAAALSRVPGAGGRASAELAEQGLRISAGGRAPSVQDVPSSGTLLDQAMSGTGLEGPDVPEALDSEFAGSQVVHHVSRATLQQRRHAADQE